MKLAANEIKPMNLDSLFNKPSTVAKYRGLQAQWSKKPCRVQYVFSQPVQNMNYKIDI